MRMSRENNIPIFEAAKIITPKSKKGLIGFGSSGMVRYCKHEDLGYFAVKCFPLYGIEDEIETKKKKVNAEAKILHSINHPNIIRVHGLSFWSNSMGILTDYIPCGNLEDLLLGKEVEDLSWSLRLRVAKEIGEALCFLHKHKKKLVHGDVKPQNILMTEDCRVKLADFGSVSMAATTESFTRSTKLPKNLQHTPLYTAPEFLKDCNMKRTTAMDCYSFAMVVYEILTRQRVFTGANVPSDVLLKVIIDLAQRPDSKLLENVKRNLDISEIKIFELLESTMQSCWRQKPEERREMDSVCEVLSKLNMECLPQKLQHKIGQQSMDFDDAQDVVVLATLSYPYDAGFSTYFQPTTKKETIGEKQSKSILNVSRPMTLCCYKTNYPERGCFIIFLQEHFLPSLKVQSRIGMARSALELQNAVTYLGFEYVRVVTDCTKMEILQWLYAVSEADHSNYDCFGCAVLTCGDEGDILYAKDAPMHIDDFTQFFSADHCSSLAHKPKLFFIDAGRGDKLDDGVSAQIKTSENNWNVDVDSSSDLTSSISITSTNSTYFLDDVVIAPAMDKVSPLDVDELKVDKIPIAADFFIANSTASGYRSWRNIELGPIFIQILCKVITKFGETLELMQMMTLVNRLIAYDFETNTNDPETSNKKQMPSTLSCLTAELYFTKKKTHLPETES